MHGHHQREDSVIVDVRTYQARQGKTGPHLELYSKHGFAAQVRHLGPPLAYLQSESGELNLLVHLWTYDSAADRERKRTAMMADPEWRNYLKLSAEAGFLQEQRNNLMVPASFAPIKR
jgi:aromatic ring-cleaving dioxygenase